MADVVLVHGAFNELWGPNELKARWLPALRDGLAHHGGGISEEAVAVCFYGDLFRLDPETVDPEQWARTRAGTSEMLESLAGGGGLEALGQAASSAALERTVDLVAVLSTQPDVAATSRERLVAAIGDGVRAVVAHSLGTVLAYNSLLAEPGLEVDTLVTLGSPLGSEMSDAMLAAADPTVCGHGRARYGVGSTSRRWGTGSPATGGWHHASGTGSRTAGWTTATGRTTPSPT